MKHGSLFSGIGGFDLAAQWMGWNNVFHCEIGEFQRKVLKHHFPESISYEDINTTDFSIHRGDIDIITGGFPCQPFSQAGKRKGTADDRHLWPKMLEVIRTIKPRCVVGENVYGLVNWDDGVVFEQVQADLENEGYEVQPYILPAASVNAPHKRDRVWVVAYLRQISRDQLGECRYENQEQRQKVKRSESGEYVQLVFNGNTFAERREKGERLNAEPSMVNAAYGLSYKLDGNTFIRRIDDINGAFGNAIVPQVAYQIFKTIEAFENRIKTDN